MTDGRTLLRDLFASWRAGDIDSVVNLFHEDAVWHFSAATKPPAIGSAQIRQFLEGYAGISVESKLRLLRQAENGASVHFEAIEEFVTTEGRSVTVPYAGVITVQGGRISDWRDFFDRALVDDQIAGTRELPQFAASLLEVPALSPSAPRYGGRLGDLIVDAIQRFGQRTAFIEGDHRISYEDLGRRIAAAISKLEALGIKEGDTIAQIAGNSTNLYAVMAAAYIGNFRSVTLHPMGGLDDHKFILRDSGAKVLICDHNYRKRAQELASGHAMVLSHDIVEGMDHFWSLEAASSLDLPVVRGDSESIIRLAYTGGTTGRPKGVMLSNRALVSNTIMALSALPLPDQPRFLCSAPLSHGAGSIIAPTLYRGGTVILQKGFAPATFCEAIKTHDASLTWLVPTMILKLTDHISEYSCDVSSLKTLIWSGSPMGSGQVQAAIETFGPILVQCYGQTEAPNTILWLAGTEQAKHPAAAGRPFPGIEIALLDDSGASVEIGTPGEICVRSPLVMSGYWNMPDATSEVFDAGWLHTGDIGKVDEAGLYHIVDRKKDMIISGGFNVFPKEVEDVLLAQPGVAGACVFGVPDDKWGESVAAAIVPRASHSVDTDTLAAAVRAAKGPIQTPKRIEIVEAIPLTGLGKPDKKALAAAFASEAA